MDEKELKDLLEAVRDNRIDVSEAAEKLKTLPFADLGYAKVDHHRTIRTGFPEVIYGANKTPEQIANIMLELASKGGNIMATRCSGKVFEQVSDKLPEEMKSEDAAARLNYHEEAKIISLVQREMPVLGRVAGVTAGTSDIPVAEEAAVTAELMGSQVDRVYDVGVAGIHRLIARLEVIRKADAVVAVAGMEGALASVVGGLVEVPVVAVPTSVGYGANLGGISALLSMLNSCSNGIGVVNIDNGFGAGYLATLIAKDKKK